MVTSIKLVAEKLLIKGNLKALFVNAPREYRAVIDGLPDSVTVVKEAKGQVDVIQVFASSKKELQAQLGKLKTVLSPKGMLWVTYPKGTSKVKADVNRDIIRECAKTVGLEAVALVSVDDTWSALRLKLA